MSKIFFKNNTINYYNITGDNIVDDNIVDGEYIANMLEIECCDRPTYNYLAIGPIKHFKTSFSSNVINILNRIGIDNINNFDYIKLYDINSDFVIDNMVECPWNINPNPN